MALLIQRYIFNIGQCLTVVIFIDLAGIQWLLWTWLIIIDEVTVILIIPAYYVILAAYSVPALLPMKRDGSDVIAVLMIVWYYLADDYCVVLLYLFGRVTVVFQLFLLVIVYVMWW